MPNFRPRRSICAYMPTVSESVRQAIAVRSHAYTPYSQFAVGAAVAIEGVEHPIVGCNVENVSFGATICAERVALLTAIAQYGVRRVEHLVVLSDRDEPVVPCALCLQVLQEFCEPAMPIYLANLGGVVRTLTLDQLLPHRFSEFTS